jgi:hypothetical protein
MNFHPVIFLARWAGMGAIVVMAMPGAAQETIQYTKPVDQDLPGKANASKPKNTGRNSAGAFNAPSSLFGEKNPVVNFDVLPGSPSPNAVSPASAEQWRKFLDAKKNWTLMTQEEVLGISTPEQILGITDPKNDPKLSVEERYLQRQDRLAAAGVTNALQRPDAASWHGDSPMDPFHRADATARFAQTLGGSIPGAARNLNQLFNSNPDSSVDVNKKKDSAWANPFGMPEPLPKPTPEQLAGMDRFRALFEPAAPEKAPEAARFSYPPAAAPDRNLQVLPAYNPAGRSFSALESGIAKPTGITPLPGITGSRLTPAKKTASLVQTPPWLSDSPQVFTPVQRQF